MIKRMRRPLVGVLTLAFVITSLVTKVAESKSGAKVHDEAAQRATPPVIVGPGASFATQGPNVRRHEAWRRAQHERLPPFMVWTSLRLRDFESCLPAEATARPVGRQGYVVSNLTDYLAFAIRLSITSGRLRNEVPRFSRVGERDPGPPDAGQKELFKKLAEIIVNLIYRPWPAGDEEFLEAALLDQQQVQKLLPKGWNPNGPVPQPFGRGRWIIICDPKPPCVRPEAPTPETVPDCQDEQDEVDRLLEKIKALENEIEQGNDLLSILQQIKAGKEVVDAAIAAMTLMAGLTASIALGGPGTAVVAIAGGSAGIAAGLALVLPALAIYAATQLLDLTALNPLINWIKGKIAELKRILGNYERGLKDALAELAACQQKAAEAEQRNTDAFQNYINVLLPAYYECLKRRKCRRVWVPR